MSSVREKLASNLAAVSEKIEQAARSAGRNASEIKLVVTTKYVESSVCRELAELGHRLFGESRPQDLWRKTSELANRDIEWHLIGHLQRNKIRRTLPLVRLIHSVDSERLLLAIHEEATAIGQTANVLLEVHISSDEAKHGFDPKEIDAIIARAAEWPGVRIHGLMGMASLEGGPDRARRDFAALRALRDRLLPLAPPHVSLDELSMGMSSDFPEAIAEGATLVRVGSAIFAGIET